MMALVMCIAIGVAVIVYAVSVIKLRVITTEDMKLIPKGGEDSKSFCIWPDNYISLKKLAFFKKNMIFAAFCDKF